MSKKKQKKSQVKKRPKGKNRLACVIDVVMTDDTFSLFDDPAAGFSIWIGKCIHCNKKMGVSMDGQTDATLEHIVPLCAGGSPDDPRNLALACLGCNNQKGIDHDKHVGKRGRADDVISALQGRRLARWREPVNV